MPRVRKVQHAKSTGRRVRDASGRFLSASRKSKAVGSKAGGAVARKSASQAKAKENVAALPETMTVEVSRALWKEFRDWNESKRFKYEQVLSAAFELRAERNTLQKKVDGLEEEIDQERLKVHKWVYEAEKMETARDELQNTLDNLGEFEREKVSMQERIDGLEAVQDDRDSAWRRVKKLRRISEKQEKIEQSLRDQNEELEKRLRENKGIRTYTRIQSTPPDQQLHVTNWIQAVQQGSDRSHDVYLPNFGLSINFRPVGYDQQTLLPDVLYSI